MLHDYVEPEQRWVACPNQDVVYGAGIAVVYHDWRKLPKLPSPADDGEVGETRWVFPDKFFDELPLVLEDAPPLPGEEARYAQILTCREEPSRHDSIRTRHPWLDGFDLCLRDIQEIARFQDRDQLPKPVKRIWNIKAKATPK